MSDRNDIVTTVTSTIAKRLITVTLLASCLSTPAFVNASSNGGNHKGPGWFGKVLGANLPDDTTNNNDNNNNNNDNINNSNNNNSNSNKAQAVPRPPPLPPPGEGRPNAPFMPPPPPPPPMGSSDGYSGGKDGASTQSRPPPPPLAQEEKPETNTDERNQKNDPEQWKQSWDTNTNMDMNMDMNMNMDREMDRDRHMSPPPQDYNGWHQQMQYQNQPPQQWMENDQGQSIYQLQSEIDHLMNHQQDLYGQVQNLTGTLIETERSNERHMSQIDILLEQVADVEAYASAESNAALEFKANCTSLGDTLVGMQGTVQNLEGQCQDLAEGRKCDEEEIQHLKTKLKKKERELENMACGVEMARLGKQKEAYQAEYERKKGKQSGGVFSWLFGWGYGGSSVNDDIESDDEMEKLQEQARSTLLNALQMERNNVEELENSLAMVQQNNSAITEMVSSRDSLIDELNDRIAVFEEDKVVLKAALRQLQKEMKDEAPKTKKLLKELKAANSGIKKLERSIESLKKNNADEIVALDEELSLKDNQINETDSRMAMISVYVDQLEERLASFAIARRDIILREEKCDILVNKTIAAEDELDQLKSENEEISAERSALQSEKETLMNDKEVVVIEGRALREELDLLNDNFSKLESEAEITMLQLEEALKNITSQEMILDEIQAQDEEATSKLAEQEEMIRKSVDVTMALQKELQNVHRGKLSAEETIAMLEEKIDDARKDQQSADDMITLLRQRVEDVEHEAAEQARVMALELLEAVAPPPPPPPATLSESTNDEYQIIDDADEVESTFGDINDIDDDYQNDGGVERLQDDDIYNQGSYGSEQFPQADSDIQLEGIVEEAVPPPPPSQYYYEESSTHNTFYEQNTEQLTPDGVEEDETMKHCEPYSDNGIQSENPFSGIFSDDDLDSLDHVNNDLNVDNALHSKSTIENEQLDHGFDDEQVSLANSESKDAEEADTTNTEELLEQETRSKEVEPSFPIADVAEAEEQKEAFITKKAVPLRGLRKQASRLTGIHGFFTPHSN